VETVFLMASENHQFIASRLVKDVALFGGDIATFVPKLVRQRTLRRLKEMSGTSSPLD
jgi:pantetheine-phosphate adenylyltransferase